MKKSGFLTLFLLFVLIFVSGCEHDRGNITISGYVIDDPVSGATIEVYDADGNLLAKEENATDSSGHFNITIPYDKFSSPILKVIAYKNNDNILSAYDNMDKKSEVYVTQDTTALINKLILDNVKVADEYFKLKEQYGFVDGKITNIYSYEAKKVKYIATQIEHSFKNNGSYSVFSDSNLTEKSLDITQGSIFDFSVLGYNSLDCNDTSEININNTKVAMSADSNNSQTVKCIVKNTDNNSFAFYNINLIPNITKIKTMSAAKKILSVNGIQIIKPSNDDIQIRSNKDATIVLRDGNKVLQAKSILSFYPDGKVLKEPLNVKIPGVENNNTSFYLTSKDGTFEKIDSNYSDGFYYVSVPHFTDVGMSTNSKTNVFDEKSNIKTDYSKIRTNILSEDSKIYIRKADISYPKILLEKGYTESSLKDNLDVKGLLALLVLKNGKGLIDFDGTNISFNNGSLKFGITDDASNQADKEQSDANLFFNMWNKITSNIVTLSTNNSIEKLVDENSNSKILIKSISRTLKSSIDKYQKELNQFNNDINELEKKSLDGELNIQQLDSEIDKLQNKYKLIKNDFIRNKIQTKTTKLFIHAVKRKMAKPISLQIEEKRVIKKRFINSVNRLNNQIKRVKLLNGKLTILKPLNKLVDNISKSTDFTFSHFRELSKKLQIDKNMKFFGISGVKTYENIGKTLGILGFVAKSYSVSLDYNFEQIDNKVEFLAKLKVYFPEYSDNIQKLINKLILARTFDYPALKQLYTYFDNATESVADMIDSYNDLYGIFTISSKFSKFLEQKGLSFIGSGFSIVNSFGQAYKTWSAANSLAYMSATASTLAYKISVNKNLSPKEQLEWYALFQTISNTSVVGWYYSDGKMAEKGDNWMYVVGNAFDVGLTVASDPTILGLADAALKSVLNEQIVSTVWSVTHGINSFRSEYNSEDELISKYITRNAIYSLYTNGTYDKSFNKKRVLSIPISKVLKFSNGNRMLSFYMDKGLLSSMSIRFDRENSGTYRTDLGDHNATLAAMTWWNFNNDKKNLSVAEVGYEHNIAGAALDPSKSGILNIMIGKNINRIEILGWKRGNNKETIPYESYINLNDITTKNITDNRIEEIVQSLQKNINFKNSNDKNITSYLQNSGYTIVDLTTNNDVSKLSKEALSKLQLDSYIAIKYYNQQQYSVAILKFKDKIFYFIKDYIFDKAKNNFQDIPNTTITTSDVENILKIKYPISKLKEEVNSNKGVFNATYIDDFFTDLDDKISILSDKIRKITTFFNIYNKNGKDITSDYYNDTTKFMYIDRNFDKEFGKISINVESLKAQAIDTNNLYINKVALKNVKGVSITAKDMKNISIAFNYEFIKNNKGIDLSYKEDGNFQNLKSIKFSLSYSYPYILSFNIKNEQECTTNGNCTFEIKATGYITDITLVLNYKTTLYQKECQTDSCPLSYDLQDNLPVNKNNKIKLKMCNHSACTTKTLNINSIDNKLLEALNVCTNNTKRSKFDNINQAKQYYYKHFSQPVLDYCEKYKKEKGSWSDTCKKVVVFHDGILELTSQYKADSDLDGDGIPNFLDIGDTNEVYIRKDEDIIYFGPNMKKLDADGDGIKDYDEIIRYRYKNKLTLCPVSNTWAIYHGNYILSDNVIAAILDNKLKDYPYGNSKRLLDLKRNKDFDHDGISDFKELYYFVNNDIFYNEDGFISDYSKDLDSNLTAHNYSFKDWYKGLNPFSKDTDGDGFSDKQEINDISQGNPLINNDNSDFDGDGLSNKEEFDIGTNPLLKDSDNDGVDDKTEVELSKNPNYKDQDISPIKKNYYYIDTDKDGIIDICETYPDKVFDRVSDVKGNQYGINCGIKYLQQETNPLTADTDGDGMPDGYERKLKFGDYNNSKFDATVNDAQKDFDSDGLPNIEEYKNKSNPYQFSSIRGNISDGFAVKYKLLAEDEAYKNSYDRDGDGISDKVEYQQDTNPIKAYIKLISTDFSRIGASIDSGSERYFPKEKLYVGVWTRLKNPEIKIVNFDKNISYELNSTLDIAGNPFIIKHQDKIYLVYLNTGEFNNYNGEIILQKDTSNQKYKIVSENSFKNLSEIKKNSFDRNSSQEYFIYDLNKTKQEYKSFLVDKSLGNSNVEPIKYIKYTSHGLLKLIIYTKDKNGIPYFYLNKFWQEDANHNGIKDKDEYNNYRYKYIDIKKVKMFDTDGDGLSDLDEMFKYFTNPLMADSDGDSINDGDELKLGTDPLVADTDGDGLSDGYEVSHKNKKRLVVVDLSLYNNTTTMDDKNISVVDTSLLSYAQNFAEGNETKPAEYSSASHFIWSNDGNGNIIAKFKPTGKVYHFKYKSTPTDPLKYDSDGDGMGDGYEVAFHLDASDATDKGYSPAMMLLRGKMVSYSNGYQFTPFYLIKPKIQKTNLQNYHDKYNPLISIYNPYTTDTDSDGLSDAAEYFWKLDPTDPSDADKDSDNDGLSNKEEILHTSSYMDGLDPHNSDTDHDGLPDGWEVAYKVTSPVISDSSKQYKIFQYTWYQYYTGYMSASIKNNNKIYLNEGDSYTITYSITTLSQNKGKVYIDFGDDQNYTKEVNSDINIFSLQHTYFNQLKYKPTVKFIDISGKIISSKVMDLTIVYNKMPKIDFMAIPTKGEVILRTSFACKSSDADGNITKHWIDFGDGSVVVEILNSNNIIHSYTKDGQYTATCYAMDDKNATSLKNINIDVNKSSQETYHTTIDENNTLIAYVEENQISAINLNTTDDNNLSYSISGEDATSFNINSSTGIVTFKTAPDYETKTSYNFIVTVTDGTNSISQNVIVNILNINDNNPVFTSPNTVSVNENQTSAIKLSAKDDDNDTLNYSISGTDANSFNIDTSTGIVTFKVAPDYETKTSYNFIATVTDGINSISQNVIVNILNINDNNPVFTSPNTVSVNENQTSAIKLSAKDDDKDTLHYSISGTDASSFTINTSTGIVTFKVAPDYETKTSYNFIATVTDGMHSIDQNVTINISNVVESSLFTLNGGTKKYLGKFDAYNHIDYVVLSNDQTKAFVCDAGIALKILDISNPTSPTLLGSYNFYYINSVTISSDGSKAFVADDRNGLKILDISDPTSPTLLGKYNTDGYAQSITLTSDDSKAFIADGWGKGIKILDVSDPASPTLLASYQTTNALSITLSKDGTKAFIADERGGVKILDVSNPASPMLLGNKTDVYANAIVLSADETKAYIASGYDGIKILDISNPLSPTLIGSYNTDGFAKSVTLSNNESKVFVADSNGGLKVIDISNITSPTLLQRYTTGKDIKFVTLSNDESKAFVADGSLKIIDIFNPATSALLGHYATTNAYSVTISKDKAFVADGDRGIKILDISNLKSPKLIKTYYTTGVVQSVTVSKDSSKLFVADGLEGVKILDISNPASPTLLGSYSGGRYEDYAYAIALIPNSTNIVVADDSYGGLKILDVSDPTSPTLIGSYSSCAPQSVVISKDGTKALITDKQNGIKILDISNPASPTLIGTFATKNAQAVTISNDGNKALVADGGSSLNDPSGSGLKIIDISNPSLPTLIGSYNTNDWANSVTLSNDDSKAFINVKNQGLKIIDISNPSLPVLLASYSTHYPYSDALSSDNTMAFIADDNQGLKILDITKDTIYKPLNFGDTDIALKLYSLNNKTFTMSVKANRSDIVTIGTYNTQISPNEYKNGYIKIPIESIAGKVGQTILTVTLSDGGDTLTRTIYLNIYP